MILKLEDLKQILVELDAKDTKEFTLDELGELETKYGSAYQGWKDSDYNMDY